MLKPPAHPFRSDRRASIAMRFQAPSPAPRALFYAPEVHRIRGEVSLRHEAPGDAERHFRTALDLTPARGEKSRAACGHRAGPRPAARRTGPQRAAAPGGVYGWVTVRFSTADLREARRLLHALA